MTAAAQSVSSSNRGAWMVLAAGVLWGTTGTAQAFAPAGATPLAIGAIRLLVGGTALLILALVRRQLPVFVGQRHVAARARDAEERTAVRRER